MVNRRGRSRRHLRRPRAKDLGRAAAALLAVSSALGVVVVRPRRVAVEGRSMEPTLAPGDRLVVVRSRALHPGDIVAVRDPRDPKHVLVKRIAAILENEIVVRGDNPEVSTDSRTFGPVARSAVLGRVVRRYAPSWRAGPVR